MFYGNNGCVCSLYSTKKKIIRRLEVKKVVVSGLISVLIVSLALLAACGTPTPTTTAPTSAAPTSAAPPKVIEIIAQHSNPATGGAAKVYKAFGDLVEKNSNGRVKFTYYWSSGLVPSAEIVKAVDSGALQLGYTGGPIATYFPMSWYPFNLPFMGIPGMDNGNKIWKELWDTTPEMRDEWKGFKMLTCGVMPPVQIHAAKSQIIVPADTKGHKVCITSPGPMAKLVTAAGGAAVIMLPPDISVSLNSGVIDSWFDHLPVALVFGTIPQLPYHTIVGSDDSQGMSYGVHGIFMKQSFFDGLPADIQKIITDAAVVYQEEILKVDRDVEIGRAMAEVRKLNQTVTYLKPDQIKLWMDVAAPVHEDWIKEYEAKGKPARMIYNKVKDLIKKYSK